MRVPKHFKRDVMYIEPIYDEIYMCQAVSASGVIRYKKSSEQWLNEYLTYFYSTNLAAIRSHVKINFDIHRMIPICVDLDYQFILFPLNSSKNKNVYFLNLSKVYRFFKRENQTVIEFICGEELVVDIPLSQCESQYNKATRIYDKYVKFKQFRERYLSTTVETIYTINRK